jgi:hypothetical protein
MQHSAERLTDDPEFAPAALASEKAAVRRYVGRGSAEIASPARLGEFDRRLRPWGSAIIAVWIGALLGAAMIRRMRQKT